MSASGGTSDLDPNIFKKAPVQRGPFYLYESRIFKDITIHYALQVT
jgi:hypothetical protein